MDKVQEIDDDFQSPHPQDTDAETGPETGARELRFSPIPLPRKM